MATETGTATDYLDLYRKLRAFILDGVSGAGWELVPGGHGHMDAEGIRALSTSGIQSEDWSLFEPQNTNYRNFQETGRLDLEFFEDRTLGSMKITMPDLSGGALIDTSPNHISLEVSSDGVIWTLHAEWTGLAKWNDLETRTFNFTPVTTRHIRIRIPNSNLGSFSRFMKLRLFDNVGAEVFVNLGDRVCFGFYARSPHIVEGVQAHVRVVGVCEPTSPYFSIGVSGASLVENYTVPVTDVPSTTVHYGSSPTYMHVWDSPMPYWFYGDNFSVVAFVKVSNTYRQFGFGHLLAYGTPQQYPLPLYVGAENAGYSTSYDYDIGGNIRGFTNPGNGSLFIFTPDLVWKEFQNYATSNNQDVFSPNPQNIWPGSVGLYSHLKNAIGPNDTDGNHILYPLVARDTDADSVYGEIPKLFLVPAFSLSSEDTITVNGDVYRVFNNIWRQSSWDYTAVKEV